MKINEYNHEVKMQNGKKYIYNSFFDYSFLSTPDKRVRRNVIKTLNEVYGFHPNMMGLEVPVLDSFSGKKRYIRTDLLIILPSRLTKDGKRFGWQPYIIVKCKRNDITLDDSHKRQGLKYCEELIAYYLILTNGKETKVYAVGYDNTYYEVENIPNYKEALQEAWVPKSLSKDWYHFDKDEFQFHPDQLLENELIDDDPYNFRYNWYLKKFKAN